MHLHDNLMTRICCSRVSINLDFRYVNETRNDSIYREYKFVSDFKIQKESRDENIEKHVQFN